MSLYHKEGKKRVRGPHKDMCGRYDQITGDCTGLWGDVSGLKGCVTNLFGCATKLSLDLTLTKRKGGVIFIGR